MEFTRERIGCTDPNCHSDGLDGYTLMAISCYLYATALGLYAFSMIMRLFQ